MIGKHDWYTMDVCQNNNLSKDLFVQQIISIIVILITLF